MPSTIEVLIVGPGRPGYCSPETWRPPGVACTMLERRAEASNLTRAFGVHAHTPEVLDARGLRRRRAQQRPQARARTP
jgi:hypothetical protein